MGFNKRYITKSKILNNLDNLTMLFKSDALILDEWSSKFHKEINIENTPANIAMNNPNKIDIEKLSNYYGL